MIFYVFSA